MPGEKYCNMTAEQKVVNRKATIKFKRTKTLAKKSLQLAEFSNIMINILIYDPRGSRLTEYFTDDRVSFSSLIAKKEAKTSKRNMLKITSRNIREMTGMTQS